MAHSYGGDIITNELFLKVYDHLKLSEINQSRNTKRVSWDQMEHIFFELEIDLRTKPTETVSKYKKSNTITFTTYIFTLTRST